ncbi:hypothetical protein ACWCQZ_10550 [Streptomyces sp. NPDC002285]
MVEGCAVASVLGMLEEREAAARVRVEGLREEVARLAEVLEAAEIELDRRVIAREELVEALAVSAAESTAVTTTGAEEEAAQSLAPPGARSCSRRSQVYRRGESVHGVKRVVGEGGNTSASAGSTTIRTLDRPSPMEHPGIIEDHLGRNASLVSRFGTPPRRREPPAGVQKDRLAGWNTLPESAGTTATVG